METIFGKGIVVGEIFLGECGKKPTRKKIDTRDR